MSVFITHIFLCNKTIFQKKKKGVVSRDTVVPGWWSSETRNLASDDFIRVKIGTFVNCRVYVFSVSFRSSE